MDFSDFGLGAVLFIVVVFFSSILLSGGVGSSDEPVPVFCRLSETDLERVGRAVSVCPEGRSSSCEATAYCDSGRTFEACHLPKRFFLEPSVLRNYTGVSNIPSLFMGNRLVTVEVSSESDLFVGCFYGFEDANSLKVHRLIGIYPEHLLFRGDNNDAFEKVDFESVKFVVREVMFK